MTPNKYTQRGVSSQKADVHKAIEHIDKGIFPGAFCKAIPNLFDDKDSVSLMHADGAGTKSSLAYLYWKETGDKSVFRGVAQDSLIMNVDDLLCVGAVGPTLVSSTIGRNKLRIPGELIKEIIEGTQETIELLNAHGGTFVSVGGETADLGDLIKTIVVDTTVMTTIKKKDFIDASNIAPHQIIIGLASFGQANYEKEYNAGIGSNGLTSARHDIFKSTYSKKYPETFDNSLGSDLAYNGKHSLFDRLEGTEVLMGKALLSPTRTYFPIIRQILKKLPGKISGIIHCSGGGQVKCKNFSHNIHYIKDNLFPFPPLLNTLSKVTEPKEMFEVFNCGHRMELYVSESAAQTIMDISKSYNVDARIIGRTEALGKDQTRNQVTIKYNGQTYIYA